MTDSNATAANGFIFEIGNADDPLTYTEVKEVGSFTGLDGKSNEIDITNLRSPAKEILPGLPDEGSWKLASSSVPSDPGQVKMRAAKVARTKCDFKATLSDETVITFKGYVMAAPIDGGVDQKNAGSYEIRVTGAVTLVLPS